MFLPIGTVQIATVIRKIETGYVLEVEMNEVLLHYNETDVELEVDQDVNVFLYNDKNNQIVATTKIPDIQMDTYGWAEVVNVLPQVGVFVDIGIAKDILVSVDDLPIYTAVWPRMGDQLYVTLGLDQEERLLALPATEGVFFDMREIVTLDLLNADISGRVYYTSREGAAIFSEEGWRGFIHHTEREHEPRLGEVVNGRVIDVKEDGTVNVSLLPRKEERMDQDGQVILDYLNEHDGMMPFGNKSDPDAIRDTFGFSKSAFKRALGRLMKEGKVKPEDKETHLVK